MVAVQARMRTLPLASTVVFALFLFAGCTSRNLTASGDGGGTDLAGIDLGRLDGGHTGGACHTDSDCGWRPSGCCSICSNHTDQVPPELGCGIACPGAQGGCTCIAGHCKAGDLPPDAPCDPNHDACGPNTMCCDTCCGVPPPDGGSANPDPRCIQPDFTSSGPECPLID
jgi:hypothetical protein